MRRNHVLAYMLVACAVLAGSAAYGRLDERDAEERTKWTAFSADVYQRTPEGEFQGRFYRRSDGSLRFELQAPPGLGVMINNVPAGKHYRKAPGADDWYEYPLALPQGGRWLPPTPLVKREGDQTLTYEGLEVVEQRPPTGGRYLAAPRLDGFLVSREEADGRTMQYRNIAFEEPPAHLFEPPSGAVVQRKEQPAGIVSDKH